MTSEDILTIAFGVIASVLALATILQAYFEGYGSRGRFPGHCSKTGRYNTSNLGHVRTRLTSSPTLVRPNIPTPSYPQQSKSVPGAPGQAQNTSIDGACLTTMAGPWSPRLTTASSSERKQKSTPIRCCYQLIISFNRSISTRQGDDESIQTNGVYAIESI